MTFSPHKGMDLAKICISKMVNFLRRIAEIASPPTLPTMDYP